MSNKIQFLQMIVLVLVGVLLGIMFVNHGIIDLVYKRGPFPTQEQDVPREELVVGAFDPSEELLDFPNLETEHLFVSWSHLEESTFFEDLESIVLRGNKPLVTIEPWGEGSENVLESAVSGEKDVFIREICDEFSFIGTPVYVRFAHEMELSGSRYPWQSQSPELYIEAYRHFYKTCTELATNIIMVWSPAGDRGAKKWWPGADVVDLVSIAVFALPNKRAEGYQEQKPFSEILKQKLKNVKFTDKPILIGEMGVMGPDEYQKKWLLDAAETLCQHPEIFGISYFNREDVSGVWGHGKEDPDWSVDKYVFIEFAYKATGCW